MKTGGDKLQLFPPLASASGVREALGLRDFNTDLAVLFLSRHDRPGAVRSLPITWIMSASITEIECECSPYLTRGGREGTGVLIMEYNFQIIHPGNEHKSREVGSFSWGKYLYTFMGCGHMQTRRHAGVYSRANTRIHRHMQKVYLAHSNY